MSRSAQVRFCSRSTKPRPRSPLSFSDSLGTPSIAVMRARTMGYITRHAEAVRSQEIRERLALLGADVDQEIVGHIARQTAPPIGQQIAAHHREQQQHHESQAERDDLHDAAGAAPRDVGKAVAPGDAHSAAQPARDPHQTVARERERDADAEHAGKHADHELGIAHQAPQNGHERPHGEHIGEPVAQGRRRHRLAQHPRGRRVLQLQQRRQGEADQHGGHRDQRDGERARARPAAVRCGSDPRSSHAMPICAR